MTDTDLPSHASVVHSQMIAALVEAKREMWCIARTQWTMADFKNWAVIQQIDAALDAARTTDIGVSHG